MADAKRSAAASHEWYVGEGRIAWAEFHSFETVLDFTEWLDARPGRYDVDTVRLWNGPGSMISVCVVFVRHLPEEEG